MTKHKKSKVCDIRYEGRKYTPYQSTSGFQACTTGIRLDSRLTGIFRNDEPIVPIVENQDYFLEWHNGKLVARVYQDGIPTMQGYVLE